MSPAADLDPRLLFLQGKKAALRSELDDLEARERTLRGNGLRASADAMRARVGRTRADFDAADRELAKYISTKQRRSKT